MNRGKVVLVNGKGSWRLDGADSCSRNLNRHARADARCCADGGELLSRSGVSNGSAVKQKLR